MDSLQYLAIADGKPAALAFSALPDAPTEPYLEGRQRVRRARNALSGALHTLADSVAPAPASALRTACAD